MKNNDELIIITKAYDLILWSCHHTSKFPRNHRFVLGDRIERNLYRLLETLIRARYSKNRRGSSSPTSTSTRSTSSSPTSSG